MKTMINFSASPDDTMRYVSAQDLKNFYTDFGCDGLELMPLDTIDDTLIEPSMVIGIHMCCLSDWMEKDFSFLLEHYRRDLEIARALQAEYVVFHVTQVNETETFTYQLQHEDEEVIDTACKLINALLDNQDYSFLFLMENLWWPGLTFLRPSMTRRLLDGVHYKKKGLMLDTGHFLHTNPELNTQKEALAYLQSMLDAHQELLSFIKGIHLHQSLTGSYVWNWLKHPPVLETDPEKRFCQLFEHIFRIDQHLPFTEPGVKNLVERISPDYLTYEYITRSREEHARYLEKGSRIFR